MKQSVKNKVKLINYKTGFLVRSKHALYYYVNHEKRNAWK